MDLLSLDDASNLADDIPDELRQYLINTEVYGPEAFARDFGELVPVPAERVVAAEDGHIVDLAGRPSAAWRR